MKTIKLIKSMAMLVPLMLGIVGCKTTPIAPTGPYYTSYPIQISLAQSLQGKSVLVDLVGVNEPNRARFEAYSMTKYWKDGDVMRANALKRTFNFTSTSSLVATLPVNDPIWSQWKGQSTTAVLVLVDLPGALIDQPGSLDARRQILSMDTNSWPKDTKELKVIIAESGPQVVPVIKAPAPAKSK
jgi:hypothetical protein